MWKIAPTGKSARLTGETCDSSSVINLPTMATPKPQLVGRRSVFRNKEGGGRVQGEITQDGLIAFGDARIRLAELVGREPDKISDADVIEYLARGDAATRKYLKSA